MQNYIYPAVLIYNEMDNNYIVAFDELNLFTEGDTVEDAYLSAKKFLMGYCEVSLKLFEELLTPPTYEEIKANHPDDIVLLIDTNFEVNKVNVYE